MPAEVFPLQVVVGLDEVVPPFTAMENGVSVAEFCALFTLITMLLSVPISDDEGVPVREPFAMLNVAHAGLFWTLKPIVWLLAFWTVGVNEYGCPTCAFVEGEPLIVGAEEPELVEPELEEPDADGEELDVEAGGAEAEEVPLSPQPAVTLRTSAQRTKMLVLRLPLTWLYEVDTRLPSMV